MDDTCARHWGGNGAQSRQAKPCPPASGNEGSGTDLGSPTSPVAKIVLKERNQLPLVVFTVSFSGEENGDFNI